ncbi:hypothetical protein CF327_g1447 [Tilletia walkeri]|nr:hypothetical protein CF327_g1447 [Tilletia walkeri]
MPPSRFATSPWRNFLATTLPDELRKQSGIGDSALLRTSERALYGVDSAGTTLARVAVSGDGAKVDAELPTSYKIGASGGAGQIAALALSPVEVEAGKDLVAVGTQQGAVTVVLAGQDEGNIVAKWKADAAISAVEFHPHASDLLLAGQSKGVSILRIQSNEVQTALDIALAEKVQLHAASWSVDGLTFGTTSSDQRLALWDPRASTSQPSSFAESIHGAKLRPTKLAFTQNHILTSGFDMGRQREWAVWDPRALSRPLQRTAIPSSSTAVLTPIVDIDRSLVYLHGKGDTSMHVVDLSLAPFTAKATPLPYSASTIALAPLLRSSESAMKGEIGRIFLNTSANDAVIPVSVTIPRRQYLDFHEDLYPQTYAPYAAHNVENWLAGENAERVRISQDPSRRQSQLDGARQKAGSFAPKASSTPAVTAETEAPSSKVEAEQPSIASASAAETAMTLVATYTQSPSNAQSTAPTRSSSSGPTPAPASVPASAPQASESKPSPPPSVRQTNGQTSTTNVVKATTPPASQPAANMSSASNATKSTTPANIGRPATTSSVPAQPAADWSRRFLAGSTPLIPEFNNVGGISTSLSAESRLLGLTVIRSPTTSSPQPGYLVFPLAGPGGRVGVHPLSQPGRFPLLADLPALDGGSGTAVVDFACSPFASEGGGEVYVLNADSKIRKWTLASPPPPLPADCLPLGPGAKRQPTKDELERSAVRVPERAELVMDASAAAKGGRVIQVEPHPHVKGLVSALVAGPPAQILLWQEDAARDAAEIQPELSVEVGGPNVGALGFAWSPDGQLVAVAGKDKKLRVGDVRAIKAGAATWAEIAAHDSPRAFKLIWLSDKYIASTGHGLGSIRQLKLYEVERSSDGAISLKGVETLPLDSSPAVLWPWWDADTRILLLYARGERAVNAFEVRLPGTVPSAESTSNSASGPRRYGAAAAAATSGGNKSAFFALPSFGHANPQQALVFLSKRQVDVANVEVAAAYLLSAKGEIQRVAWSITRARPEFFQDDIYVDTEVVEEPSSTDPSTWLNSSQASSSRQKVSLCPEGMQPLSLAPSVEHTSKLAKGPTAKELTDKEKEEVFLQAAFKKVKGEDVKGADVGTEAAKRAPANDDWSDED